MCGFTHFGLQLMADMAGGMHWGRDSQQHQLLYLGRDFVSSQSYRLTITLKGTNVERFVVATMRRLPSTPEQQPRGYDLVVLSGYQTMAGTNVSVILPKGLSSFAVVTLIYNSATVDIDDFLVTDANCTEDRRQELACPSSAYFCCNYSRECIPVSKICDTVSDCLDHTDERNCKGNLGDCSFETDLCGWTALGTGLMWKRWAGKAPGHDFIKYATDNYIPLNVMLSMLPDPIWPWQETQAETFYYLTLYGFNQLPGTEASLQSPTFTDNSDRCLRFYYSIGGTLLGTLKVLGVKSNAQETALWTFDGRFDPQPSVTEDLGGWLFAQVEVSAQYMSVKFVGSMGHDSVAYFALDRITFNNGVCPTKSCPPAPTTLSCPDGLCVTQGGIYCPGESSHHSTQPAECGAGYERFNCVTANTYICLAPKQICNKVNDCPLDGGGNAYDETNSACVKRMCTENEWTCGNGDCIPKYWQCDVYWVDCSDGTDEQNCGCYPDGKCDDGTALKSTEKLCDRLPTCKDKSDEAHCDATYDVSAGNFCPSNQFACTTGGCVPAANRCDQKKDCYDGSDELNCTCDVFQFLCDLRCVDYTLYCDGCPDCVDGADEPDNCVVSPHVYTCSNGEYIPGYKRCDQISDCSDGSDETGCIQGRTCEPAWFHSCDGKCLSLLKKCDGTADCTDKSDEANCASCPVGKARCNNGECIDAVLWCNSIPNCADCSDEAGGCKCNDAHFDCGDGKCIAKELKCNNFNDCPNLKDEESCCALMRNRLCGSGERIHELEWCDGRVNCFDWSDEANCQCTTEAFRCDSGRCINKQYQCDYNDQCGDGSDERGCKPRPDQVPCKLNRTVAISGSAVCDGTKDCPQGEDEAFCDTCAENEFSCVGYTCISKTKVCNGVYDCPDGKDELDCVKIEGGYVIVNELKVCTDNWNSAWAEFTCQVMELGPVMSDTKEAGLGLTEVYKVTGTPNPANVNKILWSQCSSGQIVKVTCQKPACGYRADSTKTVDPFIIGGGPAEPCEWPWVCELYFGGRYYCTCSIIDSTWILTAAHCVIGSGQTEIPNMEKFYIRYGTNDLHGGTVAYVKYVIHHRNFIYNQILNDIALLKLTAPLTYTDCVQPVCLPPNNIKPDEMGGWECYGTGWGYSKTRNTDSALAQILQSVKFTFASDCQSSVGSSVPDSQVCVGGSEYFTSSCNGDSGGPLQCAHYKNPKRWYVFGVTSYGPGGCVDGRGVYTRVTYFKDWVETQMMQFDNSTLNCN